MDYQIAPCNLVNNHFGCKTDIITHAPYWIKNKECGKLLNVTHAGSKQNPLQVQAYGDDGTNVSHRQFYFAPGDNNYYYIVNQESRKALNVSHPERKNDWRLEVEAFDHDGLYKSHRLFCLVPNSTDFCYSIKNQESGRVINVTEADANRNPLGVHAYNPSAVVLSHSLFRFILDPSCYYIKAKIGDFVYESSDTILQQAQQQKSSMAIISHKIYGDKKLAKGVVKTLTTVSQTEKKKNKFYHSIDKTDSSSFSNKFTVEVKASGKFLGGIVKVGGRVENVATWNQSNSKHEVWRQENEEEKTYDLKSTLEVDASESLCFNLIIDWYENLIVPFTAPVEIEGFLKPCGSSDYKQVNSQVLELLLKKENYYPGTKMTINGNKMCCTISGNTKASFGVNTRQEIKTLDS